MVLKTLSIPEWMSDFLKDNPDLSPSKMLQSKIIEIRERRKINFTQVFNLNRKINYLSKRFQEKVDECNVLKEKCGLKK